MLTCPVDELCAASPQARPWWAGQEVAARHAGTKRLGDPRRGPVTMTHTAFQVAAHPDQTLVIYSEPA